MRVKSGLWVSAYVRRLGAMPVPAVVLKRGDADAGAIFIKVCLLDGRARVLRPALSEGGAEAAERRWTDALGTEPCEESRADAYLARQREFDSDLWIVEVEDREGRDFLGDLFVDA